MNTLVLWFGNKFRVKRYVSMLADICAELGVKCEIFSGCFIKKYITGGDKANENMLLNIEETRCDFMPRGLLLCVKNTGKNRAKKCGENASRVLRNQGVERVFGPREFSSVRNFSKVDRNKNKSNASKIIKIKHLSRRINDIEDGCND